MMAQLTPYQISLRNQMPDIKYIFKICASLKKVPFSMFFSSHSLSFGERTNRLLLLLSMPFFSTLSSSCSHPILSQVSFLFPTACHRTCSDAPFVYPNIGVCLIPSKEAPNFHNYRKTILYYSHFEANLRFPFHPLAMGMSFFF